MGSVRSSVCCGSAQVVVAQINFKSKYKLAYTLKYMYIYVYVYFSGFWLKFGNFCVVYLWLLRKLPEQPKTNWSAHKFYSRHRPTSTSTRTLTLTLAFIHSLTHTLTRTQGVCAMSLTYEPTAWMFVFAKHFLTLLFSGCCCFWLPARF